MNKTRGILTMTLIILVAIVGLLLLAWIFGMVSLDDFRRESLKWLAAGGVIALAGLIIVMLEDNVHSRRK